MPVPHRIPHFVDLGDITHAGYTTPILYGLFTKPYGHPTATEPALRFIVLGETGRFACHFRVDESPEWPVFSWERVDDLVCGTKYSATDYDSFDRRGLDLTGGRSDDRAEKFGINTELLRGQIKEQCPYDRRRQALRGLLWQQLQWFSTQLHGMLKPGPRGKSDRLYTNSAGWEALAAAAHDFASYVNQYTPAFTGKGWRSTQ